MRAGGRRALGLVAIFAIALHSMLWGAVAPAAAATAADPFTVICHSEAPSPADQAPASPSPTHSQACDHCNLCSATPTALGPLDSVFVGYLTPTMLLEVLRPAPAVARDGIASNPKRARDPPNFV